MKREAGGERTHVTSEQLPTVSVLIAAHNEEKHIGGRIQNLLGSDFCQDNLTIRIGVDGSNDLTADIAETWSESHPNVRVSVFTERRGKVAVLKDLVADSNEEILVFTDANTFFKNDAIDLLLSHFRNPLTGGVCGRLSFRGDEKEGAYWRWETKLKILESSLDSCLGANGAIYAIRKALFWNEIPSNTIVDDFVIGMKVREQGFRLIYEPLAMAQEDYPSEEQEWGRRVRIGAGDYQALGLCRRCLLPSYGKFAWMFWSHKVIRWFTPHLLIILFLVSISSFMRVVTGGHTGNHFIFNWLFFLLFFASFLLKYLPKKSFIKRRLIILMRPLELCRYFFSMQMALLLGFIRFCRGNLTGYWSRTGKR